MQYFGAYRFIFESPRWATHLLIGAVCQLVPIVGPLVLMGYIYNVLETKHRHGRDQFPPFDFNRLSVYLVRGLWPFLVSVVAALPVFLLLVPFILIVALSGAATGQNGDPPLFTIGLFAVGIPLFVVFLFALHVVAQPMVLRAGFSQDLGSAFSMAFVRDFLSRVWKELLLSILFLIVTAPLVMLAGLLAFCVGVYAAAVVLMFAQLHFHYQLYELYLQRGGTPIPLKPEE
jgi:hypothetical protein